MSQVPQSLGYPFFTCCEKGEEFVVRGSAKAIIASINLICASCLICSILDFFAVDFAINDQGVDKFQNPAVLLM